MRSFVPQACLPAASMLCSHHENHCWLISKQLFLDRVRAPPKFNHRSLRLEFFFSVLVALRMSRLHHGFLLSHSNHSRLSMLRPEQSLVAISKFQPDDRFCPNACVNVFEKM